MKLHRQPNFAVAETNADPNVAKRVKSVKSRLKVEIRWLRFENVFVASVAQAFCPTDYLLI